MRSYQGYAPTHELAALNGTVTPERKGLASLRYKDAAIYMARLTALTATEFVARHLNTAGCVTCFPSDLVRQLNCGNTVMVFYRDVTNCNPTRDGRAMFILKVLSPTQATTFFTPQ